MIPRFNSNASVESVTKAVQDQGCAIIERLVSTSLMDAIAAELNPYLDQVAPSSGSFAGRKTRRTSRLVVKSPSSRELLLHPLVLGAVGELLAGECYDFQLHATHASRIEPDETAQSLHRDDGVFPFRHPSPPSHVNTIWAMTDFTEENGATHVVAGSHLWDDLRRPQAEECTRAVMPKGSLLLFDAATFHGGGANCSAASRTGVIFGYSLGWLRQEENQFLAVPRELVRTLPKRLRELLGYKNHGFLGHFELNPPELALQDSVPDVLPAQDLYTPELEALQVRRR